VPLLGREGARHNDGMDICGEVIVYVCGKETLISTSQRLTDTWVSGHLVQVLGPEVPDESVAAKVRAELERSGSLPVLPWPTQSEWKQYGAALHKAVRARSAKAFEKLLDNAAAFQVVTSGETLVEPVVDWGSEVSPEDSQARVTAVSNDEFFREIARLRSRGRDEPTP
jgi:hypothetical protein